MQIENRPAEHVIRLYEHSDTLFYCDPPYPHESRGDTHAYGDEMSNDEHRTLAKLLNEVRGKVAVSGYRCELMEDIYCDFRRIDAPEKLCHSVKSARFESLWVNF